MLKAKQQNDTCCTLKHAHFPQAIPVSLKSPLQCSQGAKPPAAKMRRQCSSPVQTPADLLFLWNTMWRSSKPQPKSCIPQKSQKRNIKYLRFVFYSTSSWKHPFVLSISARTLGCVCKYHFSLLDAKTHCFGWHIPGFKINSLGGHKIWQQLFSQCYGKPQYSYVRYTVNTISHKTVPTLTWKSEEKRKAQKWNIWQTLAEEKSACWLRHL